MGRTCFVLPLSAESAVSLEMSAGWMGENRPEVTQRSQSRTMVGAVP